MKVLCEACGALAGARLEAAATGARLVCEACGASTAVQMTAAAPAEAPRPAPHVPLAPDEEGAFAELRLRWQDDDAHRDFLSRFSDLEGLARAGARYREVLAASPSDEPAARGRDEVLRRATALALASAPRRPAVPEVPGAVKWGAVALLAGALLGAAAWVAWSVAGLRAVR